jgi:hypothetical protein
MRDIAWKLIEAMALQLTPQEQVVLGDVDPAGPAEWPGTTRAQSTPN